MYRLFINKSVSYTILSLKKTPIVLFFIYFIIFICSLLINPPITLSNTTESYKFIRFMLYFIFFFIGMSDKSIYSKLHLHFNIIFIILLILNTFNYFNLFNFNATIEPYYSWGTHLSLFGLDSSGNPDTKRLLGTLGNPNLNGIVFSFFYFYYLVNYLSKKKKILLVFSCLALITMILCQSRTVIIAVIITTILLSIFHRHQYLFFLKTIFINIISTTIIILLIQTIDSNFKTVNYVQNVTTKEHSVTRRVEAWQILLQRLKEKPLLGFGPDKAYLRAQHLHPESEYINIVYRYGIMGLILFVLFYFWSVFHHFKYKTKNVLPIKWVALSYFFICFITSITNTPFEDFQLNVFYSLILATYCSE